MKIANKTIFKNFDSLGELIWVLSGYVFAISFTILMIVIFVFYVGNFGNVIDIYLLRIFFIMLGVWAVSFIYFLMMADDYIDVDKIGEIPKKRKSKKIKND